MTMEIQSQFSATCQRTRKPARIPQLGSTTTRKATARDSFMGNAPETTRTSSTRKESADMLVDGLQDLMCPKRRKETTIGLQKQSNIGMISEKGIENAGRKDQHFQDR